MTFKWLILKLDSKPWEDGLEKVVSTIHYRAIKEQDGLYVDYVGALGMLAPNATNFISYEKITKEIVEQWLEVNLDCVEIEEKLNIKIKAFLNPPIISYPLPWVIDTHVEVEIQDTITSI
jgi:hypothetical protein